MTLLLPRSQKVLTAVLPQKLSSQSVNAPFPLHRLVPLALAGGMMIWISQPKRTTAEARLYTGQIFPSRYADGFDYPVGPGGSGAGYYTARTMSPFDHLGDDWNGIGGGNSDYGDPVYAIGNGVVVYSYNYGSNWGQVIILRHKYRDAAGETKYIDSLYGHVINRRVFMGDRVRRGQQIAQIGNNRGMYLAHLHLEIRKNLEIGIEGWKHSKGTSNYHYPKLFIEAHRPGMIPSSSKSRKGWSRTAMHGSSRSSGSGFQKSSQNHSRSSLPTSSASQGQEMDLTPSPEPRSRGKWKQFLGSPTAGKSSSSGRSVPLDGEEEDAWDPSVPHRSPSLSSQPRRSAFGW